MLKELEVPIIETDQEFLQGLLRKTESNPDLEVINVEATPCTSVDDNYLSSATTVVVTGRTKSAHTFKKLLLIKRHPANNTRRHVFRCDPAFKNEAAAFGKVIPALAEFSKCELPFPSCLHATSQRIVLQDIQSHGFTMGNKQKGLDLHHSKLVMKELGRFHGISLAMKCSNKSAFEGTKSNIQELIFVPEAHPIFSASLENALKMALMSLEVYKGITDVAIVEAVHKLRMLKGTVFQRMQALVKPSEPLSVICHGDFWINNLLFRYNGEIAEEVKFVDLQVVRYASLSTDILHFLTTSTEPEVSTDYRDELVQTYHKSLCQVLEELAPGALHVSLGDIYNQIEIHALYGLLIGFLLLPAITAENKLASNENFDSAVRSLTPKYYKKVRDLVLDFIDRGFI
ncbi:uncharacterized protein LOC106672321 isoform X2 [Cimex lectularius]|nr:uncharacterized protein LOC106672321 isoform X2 [Cimex lectularius]XP_014259145.1 uncharacterized protein LOC106672321 isoform X2 [Cimex lectularius]